jgi:hypothetical protein
MIVKGLKLISNLFRDDIDFIIRNGNKVINRLPYEIKMKINKKEKKHDGEETTTNKRSSTK